MSTPTKDPRRTPRYQRARKQRLAEAASNGEPCAICGESIDYTLTYNRAKPDPGYPTVNHRHPIDHGGDAFDPDNMEPAHFSCNSALGNGIKATAPPSRAW